MFKNPEKKKPPCPPGLNLVELDGSAWLDPVTETWIGIETEARSGSVTVLVSISTSSTPASTAPGRRG